MTKGKKFLLYPAVFIVGTYFLFLGLNKGQAFLSPFLTAVILALLMLPLARIMERKISRSAASLLSAFLIFLVSVGFLALVSFQLKNFVEQWPDIKETMEPKIEQVKNFVLENTPLKEEQLKTSGSESENSSESSLPFVGGSNQDSGKQAASFLSSLMGAIGDYLLTFIYIFFLLNYRHKLKMFILHLFPGEKRQKVREVVTRCMKVAPQYLIGRLMLIAFLAVLYSVGLGISGVDNFILISILAAFLSLIPYIGNIIGLAMAMAFGYLTSGETGILIGVIITFSIAQFLESYVLEPYVVGDRVNLHPFVVILVVVIGNMVWGILGMVLAIPIMAIVAVILLHIPALKHFGILLSKEPFPEDK
ncbi:AI-2E family transporter [Salegentibacter sp. F188]|uniref:AI-2E family transporter n=1 Tax=Autumnicola patrickiae TaxID=3075591 RepID=A0ABU3DXF0_9FLAO|nr:AI-2E family transporter [Salegentibacter sp. F188]MDT0688399.1 AI-2E family transporter [Salegentibacter sp. F188]